MSEEGERSTASARAVSRDATRRGWASVIDFLVPVVTYWLLLMPVGMLLGYTLGLFVGMWAFSLIRPIAVLAAMAVVVFNELVFPRTRGWTIALLLLRLRVPVEQVRGGRLLLRSTVGWLSLALVYFGSKVVQWELLSGAQPQSVWWGGGGVPAMAAIVWVLVLSWPARGRTLLDRAAGWHLTQRGGQPLGLS